MSNGTDDRLLVRTYRVGFGDCILLRVPDQGVMRHILIDCGNLWGEKVGPLKDALVNVLEVVGNDRLDLVVATHEHWDHIKGFETGLAKLKAKVDRVWLTIAMKRGHAEAAGLTELRPASRPVAGSGGPGRGLRRRCQRLAGQQPLHGGCRPGAARNPARQDRLRLPRLRRDAALQRARDATAYPGAREGDRRYLPGRCAGAAGGFRRGYRFPQRRTGRR